MNIDALGAYLQQLEQVNVRGEGASTYELRRLSDERKPYDALTLDLSLSGQFQAEFPFELLPLGKNWGAAVEALVARWVFGSQERLNKSEEHRSLMMKFVGLLQNVFLDCEAFEVSGPGIMIPAVIWNALVFTDGRYNWLLEFGWSD